MATIHGKDDSGFPQLTAVARKINEGAIGRPIGEMQAKRRDRMNGQRVSSLFDRRSINEKDGWAHHVGGLAELQFNIGYEGGDDRERFRHGVAFSLRPHRNVDFEETERRIRRFNSFLSDHPEAYGDLSMWYFENQGRSENFAPAPIPDSLIKEADVFIMLGATCGVDAVSVARVLDDFDRLPPLYEFVEEETNLATGPAGRGGNFEWLPGNKPRAAGFSYNRPEENIDVAQRHNTLQEALFPHLEGMHGRDNVSGEQGRGDGTFIDVAVKKDSRYTYYEVRTGLSARSCIREAFGQLMEYAYWPPVGPDIERLVVVGEPPLDKEARTCLEALRERFGLPLAYQRFDMKKGRPVPQEVG